MLGQKHKQQQQQQQQKQKQHLSLSYLPSCSLHVPYLVHPDAHFDGREAICIIRGAPVSSCMKLLSLPFLDTSPALILQDLHRLHGQLLLAGCRQCLGTEGICP